MNVLGIVNCKVSVCCVDKEPKMVTIALYHSTIWKKCCNSILWNQLIFSSWYTKFMFLIWIRNPKWLPLQDIHCLTKNQTYGKWSLYGSFMWIGNKKLWQYEDMFLHEPYRKTWLKIRGWTYATHFEKGGGRAGAKLCSSLFGTII